MSFSGATRRIAARTSAIRGLRRLNHFNGIGSIHSFRSFGDLTHNSNNNNTNDKREMNIEFLLSLFQNLHSRNLTDVMSETLAEFELTKDQTMQLLYSDTFLKLNQHIVGALLDNHAIIRKNVDAQDLWTVLKNWSIANCDSFTNNEATTTTKSSSGGFFNSSSTTTTTSISANNNANNKKYDWLRVMKIFLPHIKFEEMDATFFMMEIECIPEEYGIISKDRKYHIIKQHCFNLIEEKRIRDKMYAAKFTSANGNGNGQVTHEFNIDEQKEYKRLDN